MAPSLNACPEELFAEIFSYCCAGPDDCVDSQVFRTNPQRARAPFIVAAVCRRWREIILNHAALWHYIAIPDVEDNQRLLRRLHSYVNTVLDRSRGASIDIIFHYLNASRARLADMEPIFAALEQSSLRWRRFAVVMYGVPTVTRVLAMMTQATPNLRTLELARQPFSNEDTFSVDVAGANAEDTHDATIPHDKVFLPDTSGLRSVSLINLPQVVRHWPTARIPRPQSYALDVVQPVLAVSALEAFSRQHADADWLQLGALSFEHPIYSPHLLFPNLNQLWIRDDAYKMLARYSREFFTPALSKFVLAGGQFSDLTPWLHRIRTHLRAVDLRRLNKFDQEDLDVLIDLERLESIQFSQMQVPIGLLNCMGQDGSHTDAGLENKSRVLWPRLNLFELYSTRFQDSTSRIIPELVQVAWMRARDGPLDAYGVPSWVKLNFGFIGRCDIAESQVEQMRIFGAKVRVE